MTATVVSIDSRRSNPRKPCECPRHQLDALADRIRTRLDGPALLIPVSDLAAVLEDVLATTDRLIPPTERTAP